MKRKKNNISLRVIFTELKKKGDLMKPKYFGANTFIGARAFYRV